MTGYDRVNKGMKNPLSSAFSRVNAQAGLAMEGNELDESDNSNPDSNPSDVENSADSSSSKDQGEKKLKKLALYNERIRRRKKLESSDSESSDQEDLIIVKKRFRRTAQLADGLAEDFNMEHDSSSSDSEGEMKSSTSISSHESESSPKKCPGVKKRTQKRDQGNRLADSDRSDDLADSATDRHHNHETNSMITDDDVHTNHQDSDESTLTDGREVPVIDPTFDPGKSISPLVILLYFATQTSNASTVLLLLF